LKSDVKETVWNPQDKEDDEAEYPTERANKLIIKQILLGVEAKDEFSVVEVNFVYINLETMSNLHFLIG
jgi:Nucleoplasmin/nucleophosmin domain